MKQRVVAVWGVNNFYRAESVGIYKNGYGRVGWNIGFALSGATLQSKAVRRGYDISAQRKKPHIASRYAAVGAPCGFPFACYLLIPFL
jgi:hypothetical protein